LTKLLSKVCILSDFCVLHYIMGYYFLHQETYTHFEERCKCYEAQLEEKRCLDYWKIHNLFIEQEKVWRGTEIICLHT